MLLPCEDVLVNLNVSMNNGTVGTHAIPNVNINEASNRLFQDS